MASLSNPSTTGRRSERSKAFPGQRRRWQGGAGSRGSWVYYGALHYGAIERERFLHGLLEPEPALEGQTRSGSKIAAQAGIGEQTIDGRGERRRILRRHQ